MAEKKTKDMKQGIQEFTIKRALEYLEKDPENNAPKILDMVDKVFPEDWLGGARKSIRKILDEKGNWYDLLLRIYDLDPGVRKTFFENFIFNAGLKGYARQGELSEKHNYPLQMEL